MSSFSTEMVVAHRMLGELTLKEYREHFDEMILKSENAIQEARRCSMIAEELLNMRQIDFPFGGK